MTSPPPATSPEPPVAAYVPGDAGIPQPRLHQGGELQRPPVAAGPIGTIRGTGMCMLLAVVTLGVYTWVWYFKTAEEMKTHSGEGLGGALALVLAVFAGIVSPFLSSGEVAKLYERRGQTPPVSAATALWYVPGFLILVGPFIWFAKTNGALNDYWRSVGAV